MKKRNSAGSPKVLAAMAMLAALGMILGKFLAFNVTEMLRFSIENLSVLLAAIAFGPIAGAAVGTVQDLVGCLMVGYAINPLITLGYAVTGAVSGVMFRLCGHMPPRLRIAVSVLCAHLIGSVLVKSMGFTVFYGVDLFTIVCWRALNYLIVGTVEVILLCLLIKSKQILTIIAKIDPNSPLSKIQIKRENKQNDI